MTAKADSNPPTAPRQVDGNGFELDEWGLPLCGPARNAALEALGKPDPNISPVSWKVPAKTDAKLTEKNDG